jgi:formate hydrogenlyase subunit 3/multisubunit Na+/H+ antiporter MnhD subunit
MTDLPGIDWAVAAVMLPLLGAMAAFAWPRAAAGLGLASVGATAAAVVALGLQVVGQGALTVPLGGWGAPLGIDLAADGLSVAMLGMTAGVGLLVSLSALGETDPRRRRYFWPLWLLLLTGLNGVYLSGDLFNLYVMIEVISIAAIGLTVLRGNLAALKAGLEYLFASMLGAILFLLAVGLVYLHYGRLDIAGLAGIAGAGDAVLASVLALTLVGMALKTALFPLHYWLPAAHANATAPASALLSALVVKASLYIVLRLFQYLVAPSEVVVTLIGVLGAGAMLWGGIQALRAPRLKLLVAWSTVAQIGLVFVAFARAGADGTAESWKAAALIMMAHALAKGAMFLAAGRIRDEVGHDEIARLDRSPVRPTLAQFTFALAAVSLIGLPPSAGFAGKWLLMEGAVAAGYWHWVVVTLVGTLISVAVFSRVLAGFLRFDRVRGELREHQGWALADAPPLVLALAALGLGLIAVQVLALLEIGAPLGGRP